MPFSSDALITLELPPNALNDLTPKQQRSTIRKQWRVLSLRYHPDKNPGFHAKFDEVQTAYSTLTQSEDNSYLDELRAYYTPQNIAIPLTAFDFTQQEGILMAYNNLLSEFSKLKTPKAKKEFVQYYGPFLDIARAVEAQKDIVNRLSVDKLFALEKETLSSRLTREWRILILRMFAEEFLDDFQYRHAIASGNLYPILASSKLYNPIKLVVALVNTVLLIASSSTYYVVQFLTLSFMKDFIAQYAGLETRSMRKILLLAVKIAACLGVMAFALYYGPVLASYAFALPMIAQILEGLACPINRVIRPLATYLDCSPVLLTGVTWVVSALVLAFALSQAATVMTGLLSVVPFVILALYLHIIYSYIKLIKTLYEISPAIAVFQIIWLFGSIVVSLFVTPAAAPNIESAPISILELLGSFLMLLSTSSILEITNAKLENLSAAEAEKMEILPFPSDDTNDFHVEQTSLLGYQTASWSHRLFNTPKNADFLRPEDRSSQQQWASFFGGGAKPQSGMPKFVDDEQQNLLLITNVVP